MTQPLIGHSRSSWMQSYIKRYMLTYKKKFFYSLTTGSIYSSLFTINPLLLSILPFFLCSFVIYSCSANFSTNSIPETITWPSRYFRFAYLRSTLLVTARRSLYCFWEIASSTWNSSQALRGDEQTRVRESLSALQNRTALLIVHLQL